ncbi:hypothetical protein PAT3040_05806 [Paenibacillus agaridevorans]|uniref:Helix-turn-helix conjugative transposon-like domain-containing protein n=1 Tax=Paenibacillus agaridevorans TaxID=171404 RepID=A0A2R5EWV0_9BACL|nr:hypothetical protein [Paenibacillus agaridevorans]GBG11027.1 hypothetical protein PAT3040_05806 [Paenibacillus agaridevorans]
MEKENPQVALTEDEFMSLVSQAQNQDPDAMLKLLEFFEPEMLWHTRFIRMPQEDALQHMRLALIELFHPIILQ